MTPKERVLATLNHQQPDRIAVDFGATPVTGIHVLAIENLRRHYGLEQKPVRVIEPYQMLGEIDTDLMEILGVDVIGLSPGDNMFGIFNHGELKEFKTFWGQTVLLPKGFNTTIDGNGDLLIYPKGDTSVSASGKMPKTSYFFDAVLRQEPIVEEQLDPADNLEEFMPISEEDLSYWKREVDRVKNSGKAIIANMGGTALGDIALVPGLNLKAPKGIRDITEWYMSVIMRPDYIHAIFEKQVEIALQNLQKFHNTVGSDIDAIFLCGTDFGTQDSQFCGVDTLHELYLPYYKKLNDWVHAHTNWKTFKHSCGAIEPFMNSFIEAGFDIINPVQFNAVGMDPQHLKDTYGDRITFWGGGVDTQKVLSFGTPAEVKKQVQRQCEILSKNGGFVFNTVHNTQANVPIENMVAMIDTVTGFKG
ncbi:MAG: methyltransferase [Cyclobacteriaceae bacterium]|nr:methyltransferase [Cyclobacteriaceae bacterium]